MDPCKGIPFDRGTPLPTGVILLTLGMMGAAYVAGLFPDVMEVDAAQYASISREMAETGEYLQVKHRGGDYLDKPPLLFWLSSLSIWAFGNEAWAYKLPSFLFTVLGLWSVYRFTLIYYPQKTAWFSVFILGSCQAWFLFNNDVRTDTMLAGAVIFSVWQIARYLEYKNLWGLVLGGVGIAAAMLAKGPIGLMAPALAVGAQLVAARRWKTFFKPAWLLMLAVMAVLLLPMCYGLYKQYGMDGLEFFFWKQSFGRLTGENEWHNDAGYFYFLHTFPWAFLPWSLLALPAFGLGILCLFRNGFTVRKSQPEVMSLFGFLLPFVALSFSHYKLPHYIFVVFPFAAVFCAKFLYDALEGVRRRWAAHVTLVPGLLALPLVSGALCLLAFPAYLGWSLIMLGTLLLLGAVLFFGKSSFCTTERLFFATVFAASGANLAMNTLFYPPLLEYQPGKKAAAWLAAQPADTPAGLYEVSDHPLEFHAGRIFPYFGAGLDEYLDQKHRVLLYTDLPGLTLLRNSGYTVQVQQEYPQHHPGLLSIEFLAPSTRSNVLQHRYWVSVEKAAAPL